MGVYIMSIVELVIKGAKEFHNQLKEDDKGRYRSWEHCYKCFYDARERRKNNENIDYDYLSLQLAFYLASWGMYRGSSFLLQKDYKIHEEIVKMILEPQYDCLRAVECSDLQSNTDTLNIIMELKKRMQNYYSEIRNSVKNIKAKNTVSDTLITEVLMGTLGCVPAYDRYFVDGIKAYKVTTGSFNEESIRKLVDFYEKENNNKRLEKYRKSLKVYGYEYPQMKLLDMGFWQIGYDRDQENRKEKK